MSGSRYVIVQRVLHLWLQARRHRVTISIRHGVALLCVIGLVVTTRAALVAQQPPPPKIPVASVSADDAATLAEGWAFLAKGDAVSALASARAVLQRTSRSLPGIMLAVEAELASAGSTAALGQYESWLGNRSNEELSLLRAIARGMLVEMALDSNNPSAQQRAVKALVAAGEPQVLEQVRERAYAGGSSDSRLLASLGDESAVQIVIADLSSGPSNKIPLMLALGASGRASAIPALSKFLSDPEPVLRGYAADALGTIGNAKAAPVLRPALKDPIAFVRVRAAAALYRLGDASGLSVLQELAASPSPKGRLDAAEALAVKPDAAWSTLVHGLLKEPDPTMRLAAARMLAPHEPETARAVFDELRGNDNPAIREEAARVSAMELPAGLTDLRRTLRDSDRLVRVAAADRIMTLTR